MSHGLFVRSDVSDQLYGFELFVFFSLSLVYVVLVENKPILLGAATYT